MSVIEELISPQVLHAVLVHLPLALGMIGIPMVFIGAVTKMNNPTLRWVIFFVYVFMALTALPAAFMGARALSAAEGTMPAAAVAIAESHKWMAKNAWVLPLITAFLVLICRTKQEWFRVAVATLAVLAGVAAGIWMGITGYYGGELVYGYGIGTPAAQTQSLPKQPPRVPAYPGNILEDVKVPPADKPGEDANREAGAGGPRLRIGVPGAAAKPSTDPDTGEKLEP